VGLFAAAGAAVVVLAGGFFFFLSQADSRAPQPKEISVSLPDAFKE
jgi:hypothetical protein